MSQIKVLFVCMGNICRSPTAEGVFTHLVEKHGTLDRFMIDSAGTHAYHIGEEPDARAQQTARQRGIDLSHIRARKFARTDFDMFDHILAMDTDNYEILHAACPPDLRNKIKLFLDYAPERDENDVPDPYYGGQNGFDHVFDLVEDASVGFYNTVMTKVTTPN
ncbi:low molecular weight protein-tyrosine-phosphatase [Methylophaga sp. OBS1]|jgi:protein-tyrosine phosphatase|uniref:low molecular weight protein-tyrosine-phosphatase n=1 Tax=Methylophaga sp. OBS1 TaxID=2991933 RepID=UPI0022590594|nr:low molecular weight protein-tyrosine-phosphatase [Methylophaga sp. OBS1]MCX4192773.1 low molecular weight phosphotyrosine protein phosphatase [Methylophaga sp. OBS1]